MAATPRILAVVPARGGSKGLPGKNIRPFAGLPLIAHSVRFARLCPEIARCVVSTDSPEIASVARDHGGDVPFTRPQELAGDDTPMTPVLLHALRQAEQEDGTNYEMLLLLDPTSPAREPSDVTGMLARLEDLPEADGIVSVSQPDFNPIWHCVVEKDGWMTGLLDSATNYERRQDVPSVYRINGALYLWRTGYLRKQTMSWREGGNLLMYEVPEIRSMSFDNLEEFERAEVMVNNGLIKLPWLQGAPGA